MKLLSTLAAAAVVAVATLSPSALMVEARPFWGVLGHYMTAAIAEGYLSSNSTAGCANLLPEVDGDISLVASWADDWARDHYPWSGQLHYINTPDWKCTYEQSRDCFGGTDGAPMACVDGAIQNYTAILENSEVSDEKLGEALKFIVHFIGDIHQPLHVGFTGDEGGNTEYGTFCGTSHRRLHQVWDEDMIEKRINDDFNGDNSTYLQHFMSALQGSGIYAKKVDGWRVCNNPNEPNEACSIEWAKESVALACSTAYTDQNGNKITDGFDLEDAYYKFALPVAEMQLAKGGIRLAHVLNSIFDSDNMARFVVPREQFLANKAAAAASAAAAAAAAAAKSTVAAAPLVALE